MKNKLIYLIILLSISLVNAFPLQILPNGTLVESNYDAGTSVDIILFNNSLYIIEAEPTEINYYNKTYLNNTYINYTYLNETYVNTTCFNCTNYYNVTNYYNDTNSSLYNNSYLDNNFITNSIFNTFKSSLNYATKDELTNSINSINNTNYITSLEEHTHTWTGIIIFLIFLIQSGTIIYIIYKVREE